MNIKNYSRNILRDNFHSLTHKNFRYYWLGQCVSLVGTWTQTIGQSWLVLTITNSPMLLGIIGAMQFLPITIFSLFAGVVIDKFPKKKILLMTQTFSMILAFALVLLVATHNVKYEYILAIAFLLGCTNAVDMPTRQSFIVEIAGKEDLMNAIALNSATFNLARIAGPAIGAALMAQFGVLWCFLINGFSFIAVILGLLKIKATPYVRVQKKDSGIIKEIYDGLVYIKDEPTLIITILTITVAGIFIYNYSVLVPVFTKVILHQKESSYGFLISSLGLGSLIGALSVSVHSKSGPEKKTIFVSIFTISALLIVVGFMNSLYPVALVLVIIGVFNIMFSTTANSLLQMNSKDEYRGRVMSVYTLVFCGTSPIGSLFSGFISDKLGVEMGFKICGLATLILVAIILALFRKAKKINKETYIAN